MSRVYTDRQAANLVWRSQFPDARLEPRPLTDGRYALPERSIDDPRHALYVPQIALGAIEADGGLTFGDPQQDFILSIGGQPLYLSASPVGHALAVPANEVFRFEVHKDESGYSGDAANGNRRAELVSSGTRYGAGETVWESWTTVISPQRTGLDTANNLGLVHQWHSVDSGTSRSPVFGVALSGGTLNVYTRSDLNGPLVRDDHLSIPAPASGTPMRFVVQGTLGASGHLNVWIDGTKVVDVAAPIGYYNDDAGVRKLAYPHWGVYMKNLASVDALFHANIEWGTASLASRVATPLALAVPAGGWL